MAITLTIGNNFSSTARNATQYFGNNYSDDQVWLYFLNTGGNITYTDNNSNTQTVQDATAIQLSTVQNGSFTLANGETSTRLYAGLGASNPFSGTNGPGIFQPDAPNALLEWTIQGNPYDNVDVSYIDAFSFPTTLTVSNASGVTAQATFSAGSTASNIIAALAGVMPISPTGPDNDNYPQPGAAAGYGPEVPTISGNSSAVRWIGSSKYYISAADANGLCSLYLYAPTFNAYLAYLQANEPTTSVGTNSIKGWYIDYDGNGGYSGYLSITGNATDGYGLNIHDIRVNTGFAPPWNANPSAGTITNGDITVAANGATLNYSLNGGTTVNGQWTDAVIYSGAAVLGTIGGGPVVTGSGDFASNGAHSAIVPTFLASISASIATGLLASPQYVNGYMAATPVSTMWWFHTLTRARSITQLFAKAWPEGQEFYDSFWAVMANKTSNQGYLSPFNDRWANFSPDFSLSANDTINWQLGIPAPTAAYYFQAGISTTPGSSVSVNGANINDALVYEYHTAQITAVVNGGEQVVLDLAQGTVISPAGSNVVAVSPGPDNYIVPSQIPAPSGCVAVFTGSPTQVSGAVAATIRRFNFPACG